MGAAPLRRTLEDARRWMEHGTTLILESAGLDEEEYAVVSRLPGWSRKHVTAHVAANAEALGNLVHWAATGEETPMYASAQERRAGIERGTRLTAAELDQWLSSSADALAAAMDELSPEHWQRRVVTAQGRTVPATELPWMRAREVCVHATDLATGAGFADLPPGFLLALCDDVVAKRSSAPGPAVTLRASDEPAGRWELPGDGVLATGPATVTGPLADLAAYLTGRPHPFAGAPTLGPWL